MLVEYFYDPWGNVTYTLNTDSTIADLVRKLNPFTYRGYNYDYETGLYYLQSRYYNPQWGRFMSSDIYLETGTGVLGSNVFAYCDNDPVNKVDYMGYFGSYHTECTNKIAKIYFWKDYLKMIVSGSIYPDEKYPATYKFYDDYCQSFHFNINAYIPYAKDSREIRAEEFIDKALNFLDNAQKCKERNDNRGCIDNLLSAFFNFGIALHPLQDMIAHSGVGGNFGVIVTWSNIYIDTVYVHWGKKYDDPNRMYLDTGCTTGEVCDFLTFICCTCIRKQLINRNLKEPLSP